MNKLIKNELTKIFHKKALYVVLMIILIFMIGQKILYKFIEKNINYFFEEDVSYYEEELKSLDKNNPQEKEMYISIETNIEVAKLVKKYGNESWQAYIIREKGYEVIYNQKQTIGTEFYESAKAEYDKFMKRLESNDWKFYVKEELEEKNELITEMEKSENKNELELQNLKDEKQALEWRIEKDISYAYSNLNNAIEQWIMAKNQINTYNYNSKTKAIQYSEKCQNQESLSVEALSRYIIENKIDKPINYIGEINIIANELDSDMINIWTNYSTFILVAVVIITGTIMSEEFNKGTIKLLLVRPYKRIKILMAKFITCFLVFILVSVAVVFMQFIVTGIISGFGNYSGEITIYNFGTNSIENVGLLNYIFIMAIAKAPIFILLMTLSFALSVTINNSAISIAIPLLGTIASEIINAIAYNYEKAKFLKFFVTTNWDFSVFLYGKLPRFEPISIPFSIIICLIYFVVMVAISIVVFNKKDIKNI